MPGDARRGIRLTAATIPYFNIGILSTAGGFGSDCRNAKMSAACCSLTTLSVYGGISPDGFRI
jgi:hypothetical protein